MKNHRKKRKQTFGDHRRWFSRNVSKLRSLVPIRIHSKSPVGFGRSVCEGKKCIPVFLQQFFIKFFVFGQGYLKGLQVRELITNLQYAQMSGFFSLQTLVLLPLLGTTRKDDFWHSSCGGGGMSEDRISLRLHEFSIC